MGTEPDSTLSLTGPGEERPGARRAVRWWWLALRLGRVSNLPTVWSNVLTGAVLSGVAFSGWHYVLVSVALSCLYVGGMFLNDAFDRDIDARLRPERPIPSGQIRAATVFGVGFGLLFGGVLLVLGSAYQLAPNGVGLPPAGWVSALVLCGLIVLYNVHHKANRWSPVLMGLCRVGVYTTSYFVLSPLLSDALWLGATLLFSYLIGLTYIAKQETLNHLTRAWPLAFLFLPELATLVQGITGAEFWQRETLIYAGLLFGWTLRTLRFLAPSSGPPEIGAAVVRFIAGIALLDAVLIAGAGSPALALGAVAAFGLTLILQRFVPGT